MAGEEASALHDYGWYVIARDGDLVLRIHPGMRLGEDPAGELSFEAADAQLEFDIAPDGTLLLLAAPAHQLESAPGHRTRSIDVPRDTRGHVRLTRNVLSVATDFVEPPAPDDPREADDPPVHTTLESIIVVPEPTADGVRPMEVANGVPREPAVDGPLRRWLRLPLGLAALGSAAVLALLYLTFQPPVVRPPVADEIGLARAEAGGAGSEPTLSAPRATPPLDVTEVLGSVDALLLAERLPVLPAQAVSQSLGALLAAYPDDLRIRRRLDALEQRLAHQASRKPVPEPVIEAVLVPPILHKALPEIASPAVATADIPESAGPATTVDSGATGVDAEATELAGFDINMAPIGRAVGAIAADLANEHDLRAAADALERGLLMAPPELSAFALYSGVLASDPDSQAARMGLRSVRERLLSRARAALLSDDVDAAMAALDDAARAGAEPAIVDGLRTEADYRQRLLDAMAGKPGSLFPITELIAVSQEAPVYPRHAPAGAAGSIDLEMTVTESGEVRDVEVLGNPPMYFVRAAKRAVGEWRFSPVLNEGQPVAVRTAVKVTFRRE